MIVTIVLPLILVFIMFSLGLGLRREDFGRVVKFPRAFAVGLLNQVVLLPLIALGFAHAFGLAPEFAVGLMVLALCPGGVTSNVLARMAKGNAPLSISLTAITSLLSIITVPALVALAVRHFMGASAPAVDVTRLGFTMFLITAVPVGLGMWLTVRAPRFTLRVASSVSRVAVVLFALIVLAALAENWTVFSRNLPSLGPALVLLNVTLLGVGVLSARALRLDRADARTIALETGIQNGTLAIAVGTLISPAAIETLPAATIPAAVYSIVMYLVGIPFVLWSRRRG